MSNIQSRTYEGMFAVTKSDTTSDPAGPFAGLLVSVAGTIVLTDILGQTNTVTVIAGQEVHVATVRVGASSTATVFGLRAMPYKPAVNPGAGVVLP